MAIIGGRAHSLEEIHELGRLGYPFAEISFYDPEQLEGQLKNLSELKSRYGLYYLAHYPNEGNPVDVAHLRDRFVPRLKRLFELSTAVGIGKGTFHFWPDERTIPPEVIRQKIKLIAEMTASAKSRGIALVPPNRHSARQW